MTDYSKMTIDELGKELREHNKTCKRGIRSPKQKAADAARKAICDEIVIRCRIARRIARFVTGDDEPVGHA